MFMRLLHIVSLFHHRRQVWVVYPFCMGYRKKANSRILFGIINKHTRGNARGEKHPITPRALSGTPWEIDIERRKIRY